MVQTTKNIITAPVQLSSAHGYENVSINQIAEMAGIRSGSLYNYFETKEEILGAVLEFAREYLVRYCPDADEIRRQLKTMTARDVLYRFILFDEGLDPTRQQLHRLLYIEQFRHEDVRDFCNDYFVVRAADNFGLALDVLFEEGLIPAYDRRLFTEMFARATLAFGYRSAFERDNGDRELDEPFRRILDFFITAALRGAADVAERFPQLDPAELYNFDAGPELGGGTKSDIMRNALEMFSSHGYEKVSMRQIAQAAGIRVSSIYNHFPSKAKILDVLLEETVKFYSGVRFNKRMIMEASVAGDLLALIGVLARVTIPLSSEMLTKTYRLIFQEMYHSGQISAFFWGLVDSDIDIVRESIEELDRMGIVRCKQSWEIATAFIYSMCSLNVSACLYPGDRAAIDDARLRITMMLIGTELYGYLWDAPNEAAFQE